MRGAEAFEITNKQTYNFNSMSHACKSFRCPPLPLSSLHSSFLRARSCSDSSFLLFSDVCSLPLSLSLSLLFARSLFFSVLCCLFFSLSLSLSLLFDVALSLSLSLSLALSHCLSLPRFLWFKFSPVQIMRSGNLREQVAAEACMRKFMLRACL